MIYFLDGNQEVIKIVRSEAVISAIQTQELPEDNSLLRDYLSVRLKNDERLFNAQYMAVKSYGGNRNAFDLYRIASENSPDNATEFVGIQVAPYELEGVVIEDLRPQNRPLNQTMSQVLKDSDWRIGYVADNLPNITTTFYYVSAKDALKSIQELASVEMVFKVEISGNKITDKWVEVYHQLGNRTMKRFNYGTNALSVIRESSHGELYTALIGRGKGEEVGETESGDATYGRKINFADIEWEKSAGKPVDKPKGQKYIELPQATAEYGIKLLDGRKVPRIGLVEFSETEDPEKLIQETYEELLERARPKVLFKAIVINIGDVLIGDTVTIHRHNLNLHYQARVRKVVRDRKNNDKTQVEIGDVVHTAITRRHGRINSALNNLATGLESIRGEITEARSSADGKNTNFYGTVEPERKRFGDTWFREHPSIPGETQILVWNGEAWELVMDTSETTKNADAIAEQQKEIDLAKEVADEALSEIDEAIRNAGFTSLDDTIKNLQTDADNAFEQANVAKDSATSAYDTAMGLIDDVDGFRTDVSGFRSDVYGFTQTVNDYEGQVANFRSDVNGFQSTVAQYTDDVSGYATQVSSFRNTVDGFQSTVATYSDEVSGYATQVSTLNNTVNGFDSTVAQYGRDVNSYTTQVSTLTNTVSGFNSTVAQYGRDVSGYATQVSTLNNTVNGLNLTVANIDGRVTTLNTTVNGISSTVSGLGGRVTSVEQTAAGLQTTVASKANQSQVTQLSNAYNIFVGGIESKKNLLPSMEHGSISSYTGDEYSISGYVRSPYIPVEPSSYYIASLDGNPVSHTIYSYSDIGQFISASSQNTSYKYVGANVKYVRVVMYNSNPDLKYQLEKGFTVTDYVPFIGDVSSAQISMLQNNINLRVTSTELNNAVSGKADKNQLITQINLSPDTALIQSQNILLDGDVTIRGTAWMDGAILKNLSVDGAKLQDATIGSAKIANLDVSKISGNTAEFVRVGFNGVNSWMQLDSDGIYMSGSGAWRRTYVTPTGFDLYNGVGGSNKAGAIGYFKEHPNSANSNENYMKTTEGGQHFVGIGVNRSHSFAVGYNEYVTTPNGYDRALVVSGITGNISLLRSTTMGNGVRLWFNGGSYIGEAANSQHFNINAKGQIKLYNSIDSLKVQIGANFDLYSDLNMNSNNIYNNSDVRLKKNITPTGLKSLDVIKQWNFVDYEWRDEKFKGTFMGVIAQDTPEIASYNEETGFYAINSSKQLMMTTHGLHELALNHDVVAQLAKSNENKIHKLQQELSKANRRIEELEGAI